MYNAHKILYNHTVDPSVIKFDKAFPNPIFYHLTVLWPAELHFACCHTFT